MEYIIIIVVVIIIIIIINRLTKPKTEEKPINDMQTEEKQYTKKEYLLTPNELKFYKIIKQITDKLDLTLFCQVSLYEIIKAKDFNNFNKIKNKSIDFVITEKNCKIKICIELDDKSHENQKRIERDNFVNEIFKQADIKLIRIKVQNYYDIEKIEQLIKESL